MGITFLGNLALYGLTDTSWIDLSEGQQKGKSLHICGYIHVRVLLTSDYLAALFCPNLRFYVSAYSLARVDDRTGPYTE